MSTLVFLEHHGGELQKGALGVLSKAGSLGDDLVAGVVLGSDVKDVAAGAGAYGAQKVYVFDDPKLEAPLPQPRVDALAALVQEEGFDTVLFAGVGARRRRGGGARRAAGRGAELGPRHRREDGKLVGKRPALSDSIYADVGWTSEPRIALIRSGSFDPAETGGTAEVQERQAEIQDFSTAATRWSSRRTRNRRGRRSRTPTSSSAAAAGSAPPVPFSLVEDLAKALGGAVGATRAVVDAGWYPYATQVGQTGARSLRSFTSPAPGRSSTRSGCRHAGVIVAINKDPNAPIFEFSDLGVVGDLHEIVPKLTELVRARKGS